MVCYIAYIIIYFLAVALGKFFGVHLLKKQSDSKLPIH